MARLGDELIDVPAFVVIPRVTYEVSSLRCGTSPAGRGAARSGTRIADRSHIPLVAASLPILESIYVAEHELPAGRIKIVSIEEFRDLVPRAVLELIQA